MWHDSSSVCDPFFRLTIARFGRICERSWRSPGAVKAARSARTAKRLGLDSEDERIDWNRRGMGWVLFPSPFPLPDGEVGESPERGTPLWWGRRGKAPDQELRGVRNCRATARASLRVRRRMGSAWSSFLPKLSF